MERAQRPLVWDSVGNIALGKQVGEGHEQAADDEQQAGDRLHRGGSDTSVVVTGRPRYSPVSVRRKRTTRSISSSVMLLPSWLWAIVLTAPASEGSLPS